MQRTISAFTLLLLAGFFPAEPAHSQQNNLKQMTLASGNATPRDIYLMLLGRDAPAGATAVANVTTENGMRFPLKIRPDGTVERQKKWENAGKFIQNIRMTPDAGSGAAAKPNLTVVTDDGLQFGLIATPEGESVALLLPAVQKVREAAARSSPKPGYDLNTNTKK